MLRLERERKESQAEGIQREIIRQITKNCSLFGRRSVRVQNIGGVKVGAGGGCELVNVDAGVRMSLVLMPLAVETLDTVLDCKRELSE